MIRLIQRSSFLVPEEDVNGVNIPPGKRWLLNSQLTQHFWSRWSPEYLTSLQPRQLLFNFEQLLFSCILIR